jgi:hypothetical protein
MLFKQMTIQVLSATSQADVIHKKKYEDNSTLQTHPEDTKVVQFN